MRFCNKYILPFFLLLFSPLLFSCGGDKDLRSKVKTRTWGAMGTQISITLCGDDKKKQDLLFDEIEGLCQSS
jgi:hypothetical protein